MGGLVLAMIAGALVPAIVVSALAAREPLPRDCRSGQATSTSVEGAVLYSTGQDLWYSEGFPGKPRKLIDYAPPRPAASPGSSASASAAPSAAVTARPSAGASPGSAPRPGTYVLAADISADRKLVAFIVDNPTDHAGVLALKVMSPLDAPGTAPTEPWWTPRVPGAGRQPTVRVLDNGKVLFTAPVPADRVPVPSPLPSTAPSASPSRAPLPTPSPGPARTPSPGSSPGPSPSPAPGVEVGVYAPSPKPAIADQAPEAFFLAEAHSAWPDTRGYRVAASTPRIDSRVDGPVTRVAGREERQFGTPLAHRRLNQVLLGTGGEPRTDVLCSIADGVVPTGFSPDEADLVLAQDGESLLLDLSGTHAATHLLTGRVLAWRS
jgi:hypothetical protein